MLAAKEDLVDKVSEIASRRKLSLFALTNEALEQVVEFDRLGMRLGEIADGHKVLKAAKDAGFALVPEALLYDTMDKAYRENKNWMLEKWVDSGEWCGKYYSVKNAEDKLKRLEKDMQAFFWNARDFVLTQNGDDEVLVRCTSPRFSESYATFLSAFLEGALNALGYECAQKDVVKGFMQLKFKRSKEGAE
ncbi:hypothetical protein COS91_01180 [Candidatus Desantisbacteria bacterium CG07_land_8_20_14_0_80_39_15]|uniref:Uncharacterized protein n=1 Tax=Candidatus Desantisbacteria bacterium CG07_land_8_20_14_0_80_39_15 TaxID=1974549 RepID=A0A2M6ZI51_9BACT|nr:MAG: hypothetical protein COS91_01180 [Candidatus Desantisbacteria bacterium CG07_land_8_20_14_0_80_39_15]